MKVELSSVVLATVCVFCAYQQWEIVKLQTTTEDTSRHLAHILSQLPGASVAHTEVIAADKHLSKPIHPKSPPPIVPEFKESPDDTRKMDNKKGIYGGAGDEVHLGGFTQRDNNTISYNMWNY